MEKEFGNDHPDIIRIKENIEIIKNKIPEKIIFSKERLKISNFENFKYIGGGCNGCVFKMNEKINKNKLFSLKLIYNYGFETTSNINKRYLNELKILKELPFHNNILQMFDSFIEEFDIESFKRN